jgi:hypothetical protein
MITKHLFFIATLLGFLTVHTSPVRADAQGDMIRALSAKYSASVVTLQLVLKSSAGGESDQSQLEADGIVIDPSGLVVTTNTAIDPASMYTGVMGEEYAGRISSTVVSARIRLASGEEIPARVVLRDKDRNVAFMRPLRRPSKPLAWVNFRGSNGARMGDPVYILGRLGKSGSRSSEATVQRVVSVIEKPRRLYVLENNAYSYLGNVVFNESGQPLGLMSMRVVRGGRSFSASESFLAIVIPANDVWEVALQAPQASAVRDAPPTPRPAAKPPASTRRGGASGGSASGSGASGAKPSGSGGTKPAGR